MLLFWWRTEVWCLTMCEFEWCGRPYIWCCYICLCVVRHYFGGVQIRIDSWNHYSLIISNSLLMVLRHYLGTDTNEITVCIHLFGSVLILLITNILDDHKCRLYRYMVLGALMSFWDINIISSLLLLLKSLIFVAFYNSVLVWGILDFVVWTTDIAFSN